MSTAMPKRHEIDVQLTWNTNLIFQIIRPIKDALATYKNKLRILKQVTRKLTTLETIVAL